MIEAVLTLLVPDALRLPVHSMGGSPVREGDGSAELALLFLSCAVATPILPASLGLRGAPVLLGCFAAYAIASRAITRREGRPKRRCFGRWELGLEQGFEISGLKVT